MQGRLEGRVCVVTGAGSGIGRAVALRFAREGAQVVAAGRRAAELEATAALADGRVLVCPTDTTRDAEVRDLVDLALERFGRLDVGVNAAGGSFGFAPAHQMEESTFREWIDVHLVSVFLSIRHQLRAMLLSGGGSIVNVGTFVGTTKTFPGTVGYAAAKTGLVGLTRTVAAEYVDRNVRANVLIVGRTDTPMAAGGATPRRSSPAPRGSMRWAGWRAPRRSPRPRCSSPVAGPRSSPAARSRSRAGCR